MATVVINDNDARIKYDNQAVVANVTELIIDFPFFSLDDIKVIRTASDNTEVQLQRGTATNEFSVTGTAVDDGFTGGFIKLNDTNDNTFSYTIFRDTPVERTSDFPTSGPFNISTLNTELDKLFAIMQQLESAVGRAMTLKDSDSATTIDIPLTSARANRLLAFDGSGNSIAGPTTASVTDVGTQLSAATTAASTATTQAGLALQAASDATSANTQAQNALTAAGIPSTLSGQGGKILQVNSGGTGYELAVSATNNGVFYGLRVDTTTGHLVVDSTTLGGSESFNIDTYDNYFFSSPNIGFSLDSSGDLILTTP